MYKINFFTRFKPAPASVYGASISDVSCTEKSLKPFCDINNLLKRCVDKEGRQHTEFTGLNSSLPDMHVTPQYGDFTMYTSERLLEAKNMVSQAQQKFEALPSEIRDRFSNDPMKLVDFVNDPKNYDEGVKLGIFNKKYDPPSNKETVTVTTPEKKE